MACVCWLRYVVRRGWSAGPVTSPVPLPGRLIAALRKQPRNSLAPVPSRTLVARPGNESDSGGRTSRSGPGGCGSPATRAARSGWWCSRQRETSRSVRDHSPRRTTAVAAVRTCSDVTGLVKQHPRPKINELLCWEQMHVSDGRPVSALRRVLCPAETELRSLPAGQRFAWKASTIVAGMRPRSDTS
jgi:hypothetical protein